MSPAPADAGPHHSVVSPLITQNDRKKPRGRSRDACHLSIYIIPVPTHRDRLFRGALEEERLESPTQGGGEARGVRRTARPLSSSAPQPTSAAARLAWVLLRRVTKHETS